MTYHPHDSRDRLLHPVPPARNATAWVAGAVALAFLAGMALYMANDRRDTAAVMPDTTTGQSTQRTLPAPTTPSTPPATNR